jgi:prepilin peptidase CpaA
MALMQAALVYAVPAGAAVLLASAALHDLALRTIPNTASLGLTVIGLAMRLQDGSTLLSLLIAAAVFAGAVLCWRQGWLGGGDVKLLAATALVVPPLQIGSLLFFTAQYGGVLAVIYLVLSRTIRMTPTVQPRGALRRLLRAERWRICRGAPLPYGFAIAVGGITLLIKGS